MSQLLFTSADALAIYPDAQNARTYTYPSIGITGLGVAEWGLSRRAYAHSRAGHWCCGLPARKPDRGYPLYLSDKWDTPLVFLVASEREAFGLSKIGLDATTWIGHTIPEMRLSDWGSLDGRDVVCWLPESLHRHVVEHLWRHRFAPARLGDPLAWLKDAWARHGGDVTAIKEELLWCEGM